MDEPPPKTLWHDAKLVVFGHISWLCGLGLTRSLTVAYPALKSNFSGSTTVVGLFTTLILLGNSIGAPFSVFLMKYIGLRRQTMLAGVLYASGLAIISMTLRFQQVWIPLLVFLFFVGVPQGITCCTTAIIAKENATPRRIGTVMTLINAGASVGSSVLPHLNSYFLAKDEMDMMLYVLSALVGSQVLVGYFMPESKRTKSEQTPSAWSCEIFKSKFFLLFVFGQIFFFLGYISMMVLLSPLLQFYGFSTSQIPNFLLILGCSELVGRLVYAFVLIVKIDGVKLLMTTFILHGFGMALTFLCFIPNVNKSVVIVFSFAITGFANGGFGGLMYKVLADYVAPSDYATAFSMQHILSFGFGSTLGPLVGSGLVDLAANSDGVEPYWVAYVFGVASTMLAAGVVGQTKTYCSFKL